MTAEERELQAVMAQAPAEILNGPAQRATAVEMRPEFYSAALSLVEVPVNPGWPRKLCAYLVGQPDFLTYLALPGQFSDPDLKRICGVLAEIDSMVDVKLIHALRLLHDRNRGSDAEAVVRLLGVLDHISPGRRVVMSIIHLLREAQPAAASKAALFLGKRVQNPDWVDRQMSSPDPRVRANVIESIWGMSNSKARACLTEALRDGHNRVAGNALIGLHLAGDPSVPGRIRGMLRHEEPRFRATAAWVAGKIGAPEFRDDLRLAALDPNERVRSSALHALELLPPEPATPASPVESLRESPGTHDDTAPWDHPGAPRDPLPQAPPVESTGEEERAVSSPGPKRIFVPFVRGPRR